MRDCSQPPTPNPRRSVLLTAMGMPQRLEPGSAFEGIVELVDRDWYLTGKHYVKLEARTPGKVHRTFWQCPGCEQWIPTGRIAQHTGVYSADRGHEC